MYLQQSSLKILCICVLSFLHSNLHGMLRLITKPIPRIGKLFQTKTHVYKASPPNYLICKATPWTNRSTLVTLTQQIDPKHVEKLIQAAYNSIKNDCDKIHWQKTVATFTKEHGKRYASLCLEKAYQSLSDELIFIDEHSALAQEKWLTAYTLVKEEVHKKS